MASGPGGPIGEIPVQITGDWSGLQASIDQAAAAATAGAQEIAKAFSAADTSGVTNLDAKLQELYAQGMNAREALAALSGTSGNAQESLAALTSVADPTAASLNNVADSAAKLASGTADASSSVSQLTPSLADAGKESQTAGQQLLEMAGAFVKIGSALAVTEALREFATEALEVYGNVQKATISLTALTGSADTATNIIQNLKGIAIADALSFPNLVVAAQRMTALGFSTVDMYKTLQTAADTAAATGKSLDVVTQAIDRMVLSGTTSSRMLATLGLSTDALAKVMGVMAADVTQAFKALDESERLQVLNDALAKFGGVSAQVAQGILGQWQNLKTQWDFVLQGMGAALAPLASQLMSELAPALQVVVKGFGDLFSAIGPLVGGTLSLLGQNIADVATVIGGAISAIGSLVNVMLNFDPITKNAGFTWKDLVEDIQLINPIHEAATVIQLLTTYMDVATKSAQTMKLRFDEVTASVKSFIDTSTAKTGLLGIRTDMDSLTKTLTDAQTHLDLVKTAMTQGLAVQGQYAAAVKAVEDAQTAINPAFITQAQRVSELDAANKALNSGMVLLDGVMRSLQPTVMSVADAQAKLQTAQQNSVSADNALQKSITDLAAANALGLSGTTQQISAVAALQAAEQNAKTAKADLAQATKTVTDSLKEADGVTKALASAQDAYTHGVSALHVPMLKTYGDALLDVQSKQGDLEKSLEAVDVAQSALNSVYAETPGDVQAVKAAEDSLNAAKADAKQKTDALKSSVRDLNDLRSTINRANAELAAGEAAITKALKDQQETSSTLQQAVSNLVTAKQSEATATNALKTAEDNLRTAKAATNATAQSVQAATDAAKAARENLRTATTNVTTAEQVLQGSFGVTKGLMDQVGAGTIQLGNTTKGLEDAYHELGMKSATDLQTMATAAQQAYATIAASGTAGEMALTQALENRIQAQLNAAIASGADTSALQKLELQLAEAKAKMDALKDSAMVLANVFNSIQGAVTGAFQAITTSLVKDLFEGVNNDALKQQIAGVQQSMADATTAWKQAQSDIAAQMKQAVIDNKQALDQQLANLQSQLDDKTKAYQDYVTNYQSQVADLQSAEADKTSQQVQALQTSLAQETDSYEQFKNDTIQKMSDVTQASQTQLDQQLSNLHDQLSNQTESYDQFVDKTTTSIARIGEAFQNAVADQGTNTGRNIADKQTEITRAQQDTATKIQRLRENETVANKQSTDQQIADLQTALQRKEQDAQTYIQRAQQDLATFTEEHKQQADQQTADLETALAQRTSDYDAFVAQNKQQADDATKAAKTALDKQKADLEFALIQKQTKLYIDQVETQIKIAAVTKANADELAKQEAALKASLDKQTAAYNAAKASIEQQMKDATSKAASELAKQEATLQASLDKQATAYKKAMDGYSTQLDTLQTKFKTVWDGIAAGLTSVGETMLGGIVNAFFKPLEDRIASFIAGALANLLGGFGKVSNVFVSDMPSALAGLDADFWKLGQAGTDAGSKIAQAMTGVAPQAGQAAGGAGSAIAQASGSILSSVSTIMNMVTGAISAITGIISIFQNMHQESTLNAIEKETARMAIYLGDQGGNSIQYYTGKTAERLEYVNTSLDDIKGHIWTMTDALKPGGAVETRLADISNNTFWAEKKLEEINNKTGKETGGSVNVEGADLGALITGLQNINNTLQFSVGLSPWFQTALQNINNSIVACAGWLQGISGMLKGGISASGTSGTSTDTTALATLVNQNFASLETWLFKAFGNTMSLPALPTLPMVQTPQQAATPTTSTASTATTTAPAAQTTAVDMTAVEALLAKIEATLVAIQASGAVLSNAVILSIKASGDQISQQLKQIFSTPSSQTASVAPTVQNSTTQTIQAAFVDTSQLLTVLTKIDATLLSMQASDVTQSQLMAATVKAGSFDVSQQLSRVLASIGAFAADSVQCCNKVLDSLANFTNQAVSQLKTIAQEIIAGQQIGIQHWTATAAFQGNVTSGLTTADGTLVSILGKLATPTVPASVSTPGTLGPATGNSVTLQITNHLHGSLVGSNGMNELVQKIGDALINKLRSSGMRY